MRVIMLIKLLEEVLNLWEHKNNSPLSPLNRTYKYKLAIPT